MKRWFAVVILVCAVATGPSAAAKGPEVNLVDDKLSINVEAISIGRLLRLLDMATGMKSKVPAELANRNISVKFSGLNVTDGVRKIFQGQPLDYVVLEGKSVIVTAASQTASGPESAPAYNPPSQQIDQPFVQDFPPLPPPGQPAQQFGQQPQQQQPAMIQTPFGPIANPRAGQQAQQPNAPLSAPGQQNSLFPQNQPTQPNGQPQQMSPPFPGSQPNTPTPFGVPSPYGTTNPPASNPNSLFGAPPGFNSPGAQRTP